MLISKSKELNNILFSSFDLSEEIKNINFEEKHISKMYENIKISFAIMTFNEERCISRCLDSIQCLADEIVVIDTGSTDSTIELLKSNSKVSTIEVKWNEDFSEIRNQLIKLTKNEWVFMIDADEHLSKEIQKNLKKFLLVLELLDTEIKILSPRLINHDSSEIYLTQRVFKKNRDLKYYGYVHEELRNNNNAALPYFCIEDAIYHDGYKKEIVNNKEKNLRNKNLLLKMIQKEPSNLRWYYFLAREELSLGTEESKIEELLNSAILNGKSEEDFQNFKAGIYSILSQVTMFDSEKFWKNARVARKLLESNIDIYYFELIKTEEENKNYIRNILQENINSVLNIENTESFIHSSGDHLIYMWGKYFFSINEYEQAVEMWSKIESPEIKEEVFLEISKITNIFETFMESIYEK